MRTGLVVLAMAVAAPVAAQMPAPAASVKLADARGAADAVFSACPDLHLAVAVLDAGGGDKLVVTGDGTWGRMADFARRKAMTAMTFAKPSSAVRDEAKADAALAERLKSDPKLIGFGGGFPLGAGGAFAVAGAPGQEIDERCARAGLALLGG